ncbi:MAG: putative bifunctional diguanylate cyclase/phosphodiesterase [Vicinamibacterales bacterium]
MTPVRLLLVDDEAPNRDMLSRRLERRGFEVGQAASGVEALAALDRERWAAVLLDVQMPAMSGLQVLERIRTRWSQAELPVLMVTARDASEDVVAALELGANDYITKPVDFPVALARLRTQLARRDAEERLRASEERYALAARGANDGLWDWDLASGQFHYSVRWLTIVGREAEGLESTLQAWLTLTHDADRERLQQAFDAHLEGRTPHFESEHRLLHASGGYRWVLARGLAVRNADGATVRMAGSLSDITAGKVVDQLTGLPNRMLLHDRLERALGEAGRPVAPCAVLLLDIDGFKLVNDGHGRTHGDDLLRAVARRLDRSLRPSDSISRSSELAADSMVARLGGDEFVVVLHDIADPLDATSVAERLQRVLARPFTIGDREIFVSASVGVAMSGPGATPDDLLRNADTAMHRARLQGRGRIEVFELAMGEEMVERLQLDTALRQALAHDEFLPHYQPIVDLQTGRLVGFEALMRWRRHDGRLIPPAMFIPTLETNGLIVPVGERFALAVCRQLRAWRDTVAAGLPLWVNVNFTTGQLAEPGVLDTLLGAIAEAGIHPADFVVEITESSAIGDVARAAETLSRFRDAGLRVVLDDFGTGFSSLSCLHELPIAGIKLDRSFISSDRRHPAILQAVVHLADELGLTVTAEGIETDAQHAQLRRLGCGFAQGYLFARPLDVEAATDLIRRGVRWLPADPDEVESTAA